MEKIRNKIADLTASERSSVLQYEQEYPAGEYAGKTLGEFIEQECRNSETLTELMEEMADRHLCWPFRSVEVNVEVRVTRRYRLAVIDDKTVDALAKDPLILDEIDPDFSIRGAFDAAPVSGYGFGCTNYDYEVVDDKERVLVPFDD